MRNGTSFPTHRTSAPCHETDSERMHLYDLLICAYLSLRPIHAILEASGLRHKLECIKLVPWCGLTNLN